MKKSDLISIPWETIKSRKHTLAGQAEKVEHIYTASLIDDVLMVTFYGVGRFTNTFRVFSDGKKFLTLKQDGLKWSKACADFLLSYYYKSKVFAKNKAAQALGSMFFKNGEKNTLDALLKFQHEIRDKNYSKRVERIRISQEDVNSLDNSLPKDITQWVDNVPMKKSRYFIYHRTGKLIRGYCTHCEQDGIIKRSKHLGTTKCPNCNSVVIMRSIGLTRGAHLLHDYSKMIIPQKGTGALDGAIVLRCFDISRRYGVDDRGRYGIESQYCKETFRYIIKGNKWQLYEYKSTYSPKYDRYNKEHWHKQKEVGDSVFEYYLYTKNIKKVLTGSPFQYSAIEKYAAHAGAFRVLSYLSEYLRRPCLEYLTKLKLYRLAEETFTSSGWGHQPQRINVYANNLKEVLGVGKEDVPFIRANDCSSVEVYIFKSAKRHGYQLTKTALNWIRRNIKSLYTYEDNVCDFFKYMSPEKMIKYLTRQIKLQGIFIGNIIRDWDDYIRNASMLGFDLKIDRYLFPNDLKKAHDDIALMVKIKKNEIHENAIRSQEEKLNALYEYAKGDFIIRAPHGVAEIVSEGTSLNHCVGTYIERIAEGRTSVMFIRKKEESDKPFYTVEIHQYMVRQVRGKNNVSMTEDVKKFVDQWKAKLDKREKPNQMRITVPA